MGQRDATDSQAEIRLAELGIDQAWAVRWPMRSTSLPSALIASDSWRRPSASYRVVELRRSRNLVERIPVPIAHCAESVLTIARDRNRTGRHMSSSSLQRSGPCAWSCRVPTQQTSTPLPPHESVSDGRDNGSAAAASTAPLRCPTAHSRQAQRCPFSLNLGHDADSDLRCPRWNENRSVGLSHPIWGKSCSVRR